MKKSREDIRLLDGVEPNGSQSSEIEQERRKRLRLSLASEQFKLTGGTKVFSVLDLSHEGMGLRILDAQDFILFTVGAQVEGHLNIGGQKILIHAQVKHLASQTVGCEFKGLGAEVQKQLEAFLAPAAMGRAMRLMPSVDGLSVWYHGSSGTDLLLTGPGTQKDQLGYQKMTLYARGHYVQWEQENGISSGRAESAGPNPPGHSEGWGVVRFETTLMIPDERLDPDKLSIAKALILGSKLPPELKNWCLSHLSPEPRHES